VHGYREDLAYIHDAGFRDFAMTAAPGLLGILRRHGVREGLIVDLGCGSGRWASALNRAGYQVLGVDQSPSMIKLARGIAPAAQFRVESLLRIQLPACDAVTSMGECLNYSFDAGNSRSALRQLFRRVYRALRPGGVFVFDVAEPSRLPKQLPRESWREGRDWAVLVSVDGRGVALHREIVCFRKTGKHFRRSHETHTLRLYQARDLENDLARCGFQTRIIKGYGRFRFPPGITGIVAVKP
jgi:SAM-dependent methyltransferase